VLQILQVAIPPLKTPLGLINAFFLAPFLSGAGIYFVYRYLSTQTSDLGGAFGKALEKLPNLILGFLLYLVAVVLGLCLLIVPGIYVSIRLGFVLYGVIIDDLDAVSALKSSWNLVEGRWLSVFGSQLVPVFFFVLPVVAISFFLGLTLGSKAILITTILGALVGLAATPFLTTYYTKLYLRLKELTE
jgi:membrane-anchored glycerophosphoryl diester phosphodiesterase (GDPDase)